MIPQIIYDDRHPEKWQPLIDGLKEQGITDYKIWEPVFDSDSVIRSINLSHKQIVQWAKFHNLHEICILEDDVMFTAPGAWQRFLDEMPLWPFDIYLGGTYGLNKPITGKIDKINGLHCFIIRQRFYDTFLGVHDDIHIDVALDNLGCYYICYPFVALQRPGFSANSRAFSDKNADLSKEDIYTGL